MLNKMLDLDEDLEQTRIVHTDYVVSGHAIQCRTTFPLPTNVRVVMLCANKSMCACAQATFQLFRTLVDRPFGDNLQYLAEVYNRTVPRQCGHEHIDLCVFGAECPEMYIFPETGSFRDGVFQVPCRFQRHYVADHRSKTGSKALIGAGTVIEYLPPDSTRMDNLISGRVLPNRLEQLLIYPVPTTTHHSLVHMGQQERFIQEEFLARALLDTPDARSQFENIASTGSVILPHPEDYMPLMSYSNNDRHINLSQLIYRIGQDNPHSICTVLVAGCKTFEARRYKNNDRPMTASRPLKTFVPVTARTSAQASQGPCTVKETRNNLSLNIALLAFHSFSVHKPTIVGYRFCSIVVPG